MAEYLTVTCRLPASAEEPLAHAMQDWPVLGCQVEDAGGDVEVTVYLGAGATAAVPAVQEGLRRLGASDVETGPFAEHDWLSEYRRSVTPRALGQRWWVAGLVAFGLVAAIKILFTKLFEVPLPEGLLEGLGV